MNRILIPLLILLTVLPSPSFAKNDSALLFTKKNGTIVTGKKCRNGETRINVNSLNQQTITEIVTKETG